jgi:hypothetical protein
MRNLALAKNSTASQDFILAKYFTAAQNVKSHLLIMVRRKFT